MIMKHNILFAKVSAFLLSLLLLMSALPVTAFSDEGEATAILIDAGVGKEARSMLVGLDMLLTPQEDLNAAVSRADFAKLLADMENYTGFYVSETGYRDLNDSTKNIEAVSHAIAEGYMAGSNGLFRAEEAITYSEAARAFVVLTGNALSRKISNEAEYLSKAGSLGILRGIRGNGAVALSAGAAYKMAVNTLKASAMKVAAVSTGSVTKVETGDFLSVVRDIKRIIGLLTKTRRAGIYTAEGTGIDAIELDQNRFLSDEDWSEYLGCMVYAYIDYSNGAPEVLHVIPTSDNETVKLKAEDIVEVDKAKTKIIYNSDPDNEADKSMKLSLSTMVVWNGAYGGTLTNYACNELSLRSAHDDCKPGYVRLVDYDADGVCDVMLIMSYEIFFTKSADSHYERLNDVSGKMFDAGGYVDSNRFFYYESGGDAEFDLFDKEQVIHIAESRDRQMVTAVIGEKSIEATVTEIREGKKFLADGVWYEGNDYFCENYTDLYRDTPDNIKVGWHGYLLLDIDGRIAALQPRSEAILGYLTALSEPEGMSSQTQARIFSNYKTEESAYKMQNFDFADSVRVQYTDALNVYKTANVKEGEIRSLSAFIRPDGSFNHQLVRFTLNKNNMINSLQAANESRSWGGVEFREKTALRDGNQVKPGDSRWFNEHDEFALTYDATNGGTLAAGELSADNAVKFEKAAGTYNNGLVLAGIYTVDKTETPLWVIPPDSNLNDETMFNCVELRSNYTLGSYPNIKVYDLKKDGTASAIVWQMADAATGNPDWELYKTVFVTQIKKILNSEDEITTQLTGYRNTRYSNEKKSIIELTPAEPDLFDEVKVGDIVQYNTDAKNNVTIIQRLFSYKDGQSGFEDPRGENQAVRQNTSTYFSYDGVPYWGKVLFENRAAVTMTFKNEIDNYGDTAIAFQKTNYFEWIVFDTKKDKAWLDKTPTVYSILDVGDPAEATDVLALVGSSYSMGFGVIYLK